jgi:hypothetical protein
VVANKKSDTLGFRGGKIKNKNRWANFFDFK